jgi:hypothetical protein
MPCHNRQESNQVAEWLASPYSESAGGLGCTGCHAGRCSGQTSARDLPEAPTTVEALRPVEAARVTIRAICSDDGVHAEVAVSNVGVGHLLPSASRERTLLLEVTAQDQNQEPLPEWDRDRTAGAGWAMAGAMTRLSAEQALPGSSVTIQQRLLPFATDVSRHRFAAPESGPVWVSARLVLMSDGGSPLEIATRSTMCQPPGEER